MAADLLTAREVAERLGISVRTVWQWTARGILPAPFRRGRVTRWRAHDVTAPGSVGQGPRVPRSHSSTGRQPGPTAPPYVSRL